MIAQDWVNIAFYLLAAMLVVSAVAVVALPRILHGALAMLAFFVTLPGIWVLMNAEFVAVVQILVYVGAVTVLFLFAIMLTHRSDATTSNPTNGQWAAAGLVALAFLGLLLAAIAGTNWPTGGVLPADVTEAIGRSLLGQYSLSFEVASVLLLVAMVGAIVIARDDDPRPGSGGDGR